jgi:hypothetical protein
MIRRTTRGNSLEKGFMGIKAGNKTKALLPAWMETN